MKKVAILPSFEHSVDKLSAHDRQLLAKSLERFNVFLVSGHQPPGFRFKKIDHNKYEFRVNIRLRVITKAEGDIFYLILVGSHDEVRRHLRNFR